MKFLTALCMVSAVFALIDAKDMDNKRFAGNKYVAMNRWNAAFDKAAPVQSKFAAHSDSSATDGSTENPASAKETKIHTDSQATDNSKEDSGNPAAAFSAMHLAVKLTNSDAGDNSTENPSAAIAQVDSSSENPPEAAQDTNPSTVNPAAASESQDVSSETPAAAKFAFNKLALAAPSHITHQETAPRL